MLLVLDLPKMKVQRAPGRIAAHMGMGERRHALQQCEAQQKSDTSDTSHFQTETEANAP